jgi:F0F1-type ATP synthase assembly protein I
MVNDAGCHSFDVLMSKTRQQNDSQHLLNPLNHYNERTYCRLKSKLRKQLRKKTSDAASPKSVKSRNSRQISPECIDRSCASLAEGCFSFSGYGSSPYSAIAFALMLFVTSFLLVGKKQNLTSERNYARSRA